MGGIAQKGTKQADKLCLSDYIMNSIINVNMVPVRLIMYHVLTVILDYQPTSYKIMKTITIPTVTEIA